MLGGILLSTVDLSIVIGGIIVVLLMLRPFLYKRFALKWWYGTWLVLAIRLLVPFNGEVQMNLIQIGEKLVQDMNAPQVNTLIDLTEGEHLTNETLSSNVIGNGSVNQGKLEHGVGDLEVGSSSQHIGVNRIMNSLSGDALKPLIVCIWLIGGALFISYQLVIYLTFQKECRRWSKASMDGVINKVFMEVCKELHITKPIGLQVCKKVDSPLVIGYCRPRILLPSRSYEEQELYFIFKHELLHYKYGDLWYKLLLISVRTIHWFNPLVHIMAKYAEEDLEVICDSRVLQGEAPEMKKSYMEAILKVADSSQQKGVSLSTQFKGNKQTLKQRFEAIVNGHKKQKGLVTFIMITCIGLLSGCIGVTREEAKPSEEMKIEDMREEDLNLEIQEPVSTGENELGDTQVLMINGYEIRVPLQWKIQRIKEADSTEQDPYSIIEGLYKDNQEIGGARLINHKIPVENMINVFDLPVKGREIEQKGIQSYSVPLIETQYKLNGTTSYVQYVFYDLANPPPYGYALYFDLSQVNQEEINQILDNFKIPDLGIDIAKLPPKNRKPLTLEEAKMSATYELVGLKDKTEEGFNLDKLDNFIENQRKGIPDQLDVLAFIETENGLVIKNWYYIIFDGQVARSFGYYELEDGTYTYDNMPVVFSKILREYYPEQGIISYRLVGEDGNEDSTMRFFAAPATNNQK